MGALKQMELENEAGQDRKWHFVANREGYRCKVCCEIPPFEEREIYFETKMCGWHAYMAQKKD